MKSISTQKSMAEISCHAFFVCVWRRMLPVLIFYTVSAISYSRRSESSQPRQGSVMDLP